MRTLALSGRLCDVPGVKMTPAGNVTFKVKSKRNPSQDRNEQHSGYAAVLDYMRAAYSLKGPCEVKYFSKEVVIEKGRDRYVLTFD